MFKKRIEPMLRSAALPFVLRREHSVVSRKEVMSTREQLHGLLHLRGDKIVVQWRTSREVSYVGREIRTDRELEPLREVAVPLVGLATARKKRVWSTWRFVPAIMLTAADLRAFEALTDEQGVPGLVMEHPAEIVLEVRRSDRRLLKNFVSELNLAISEQVLVALEREAEQHLLEDPETPMSDTEASIIHARAGRQKT